VIRNEGTEGDLRCEVSGAPEGRGLGRECGTQLGFWGEAALAGACEGIVAACRKSVARIPRCKEQGRGRCALLA
jgi:hypothetical protein